METRQVPQPVRKPGLRMVTWAVGLSAAALSIVLGTQYLGWTLGAVLLCILIANICGYLALLLTLTLERQAWTKRTFMRGAKSTWAVFWVLSLGGFFAFSPAIRDWTAIQYLLLPLVLSNGIQIPFFGMTQDAIVRRIQRKAREAEATGSGQSRRSISIPMFARNAWDVISFKSSN